jgi:hypothetical protein
MIHNSEAGILLFRAKDIDDHLVLTDSQLDKVIYRENAWFSAQAQASLLAAIDCS